ncbi:MAG: hypothetical protein ACTSRI_12865 [Promethearchaeota archaeon]
MVAKELSFDNNCRKGSKWYTRNDLNVCINKFYNGKSSLTIEYIFLVIGILASEDAKKERYIEFLIY